MMFTSVVPFVCAAAVLCFAAPSVAQSWPTKPVRLILSQSTGSSPDVAARLLTERLTGAWGKNIVVDNRPGGQNVIGATAAARAAADGYNYYYATTAALVLNAYTFKSLPYDPRRDFTPVGMIGHSPFVVAVHPGFPPQSLPELIAYAKANPDRISVATEGPRTFSGMMADMLAHVAGIRMTTVPYSGVGPAIVDTTAGRTQVTVQAVAAAMPHLKRGALRPIAVTSARRVPGLEHVPPLAETFAGFQYSGWHAIVAPARTPPHIIKRVNADLDAALRSAELTARLLDLGIVVHGGAGTPQELGDFLKAEHARWGDLVRRVGVVPE